MIRKFSTAVLLSACSALAVAETRPNVVLFLVDDMGWTDTGFTGSDLYQTPHIDKLSRDGVIFTNAYAACTVCSPTRASIVTGKYPARLHLTDWIPGYKMADAKMKLPDWRMYLPQEEVTIAEIFKANGYATGHFGKWHLGEDSIYWPENQGFDLNVGGWSKGSPNKNQTGSNGYFSPYGNPRLKDGPVGEHLTERLANEACGFMEKHQTRPFFMNVWFYNVHTPLQAKEEKIRKYEQLIRSDAHHTNPVYAAMVEHTDDAVGQIIDKLKSLGLYENTIIIFTSDNGGLLGKNRKITSNHPLRLGKGNMYEGGVRVPFILKNAGTAPGFTNDRTPIMSIDILPTLSDLANLEVGKKVRGGWDGRSFASLVKDNNAEWKRESIFFHYPHYHSEGAKPYSAVRSGDWKLVHIIEDNLFELYNLKDDLGETTNLAAKYPEQLEKMKTGLARWKSEVNAQMPDFK